MNVYTYSASCELTNLQIQLNPGISFSTRTNNLEGNCSNFLMCPFFIKKAVCGACYLCIMRGLLVIIVQLGEICTYIIMR